MINTYIGKILKYTFALLSIAIFLLCILGSGIKNAYKLDISEHNLIIFLCSLGTLLLVMYLLSKLRIFAKENTSKRGIFILSLVLFIIQLIVIDSYYFKTGWDVSVVVSTAEYIAQGIELPSEVNNYFSHYPNNIFLTLIFSNIISFSKAMNIEEQSYFIWLVLQSIINVLTGLFLYLVLDKLFEKKMISWLGYSFYFILVWLSPWVSIPYSDSMGLLFPILTIYLFVTRRRFTVFKIVLMAIVMVIGYSIKPQSAIVFIAILFIALLSIRKNNLKMMLKCSLIFMVSTIIAGCGIHYFTSSSPFILDKEQEISYTHFVTMGLNDQTDGGYLWEDVDDSFAATTKQDRNTANIKKIKERLSTYGVVGLVNHQTRKTLNNYNDGTFGWGLEGSFFDEIREEFSPLAHYTRNYYYLSGSYYEYFKYIAQGTWLLVLFLTIGNIFKSKKDSNKEIAVVYLSLIGLFLFESIFESRSRYLYTYVPIFIVAAGLGVECILSKCEIVHKNYKLEDKKEA